MLNGTLVKDVLLDNLDAEVDKETLESLDLHTIMKVIKGTDTSKPFVFNIYGKTNNLMM